MMWTCFARCLRLLFWVFVVNAGESNNLTDIYLLGLFPLSGSWNGGQAMRPAVKMAVEDINARPDILPGYRVNVICSDTKCDAGLGVKALAESICESPTKIMIIGAGCSPVSQAVALTAHRWNLVQLSYVSLSPTLSNKQRYPNFFRLVTSESAFNEARMEIFKYFKWKRVATMHQSYQLFSTMAEDMVNRLKEANFDIAIQVLFSEDPETAVRRLKEADARIIIAGFYRDKARKVFCHAYNMGFYGKQVWFVTGSLAYDDRWWKEEDPDISCTPAQLEKVIQGMLLVDNLYYNMNENEEGVTGMSAKKYKNAFETGTRRLNQPVSGANRSASGYDSAWAAAIALNMTMNHLIETGSNKTLASFTYDDQEMADILKDKLLKVDFVSASGRVSFDKNGDGNRLIGVQMIKGSELLTVGTYDKTRSEGSQLQIDDIWDGNTPRDSIEIKQVSSSLSIPLYISMCTFAGIGIIVVVVFLSFNIINRNVKIIRMSSPNINNIILVGCVLAYVSVFIEDINLTLNNVYCKAKFFLLLIGFSLSYGALFAKTWRVYSVFTASLQMRRMSIKDHTLFLMIGGLVLFNSAILVVWTVVDPQTIATENIPDQRTVKGDRIIQFVGHYCSSSKQDYFLIAIMLVQGIFLLLGVFLAWQTRQVKFSVLNESQYIGMCIYNVVTLGVIGAVVSFSVSRSTTLKYGVIAGATILCTSVTQCLLFIPKMAAYRNFKQGKLKDASIPSVYDTQPLPLPAVCKGSQTDLASMGVDANMDDLDPSGNT